MPLCTYGETKDWLFSLLKSSFTCTILMLKSIILSLSTASFPYMAEIPTLLPFVPPKDTDPSALIRPSSLLFQPPKVPRSKIFQPRDHGTLLISGGDKCLSLQQAIAEKVHFTTSLNSTSVFYLSLFPQKHHEWNEAKAKIVANCWPDSFRT